MPPTAAPAAAIVLTNVRRDVLAGMLSASIGPAVAISED
jgi:hypothetical protein